MVSVFLPVRLCCPLWFAVRPLIRVVICRALYRHRFTVLPVRYGVRVHQWAKTSLAKGMVNKKTKTKQILFSEIWGRTTRLSGFRPCLSLTMSGRTQLKRGRYQYRVPYNCKAAAMEKSNSLRSTRKRFTLESHHLCGPLSMSVVNPFLSVQYYLLTPQALVHLATPIRSILLTNTNRMTHVTHSTAESAPSTVVVSKVCHIRWLD